MSCLLAAAYFSRFCIFCSIFKARRRNRRQRIFIYVSVSAKHPKTWMLSADTTSSLCLSLKPKHVQHLSRRVKQLTSIVCHRSLGGRLGKTQEMCSVSSWSGRATRRMYLELQCHNLERERVCSLSSYRAQTEAELQVNNFSLKVHQCHFPTEGWIPLRLI